MKKVVEAKAGQLGSLIPRIHADNHKMIEETLGLTLSDYTICRHMGGGSFGQVYLAKSQKGRRYVVKQEILREKGKRGHLLDEYKLIRYLQKNCTSIVRALHCESIGAYNFMVLDLKGPNLSELYSTCGKHFSSKCVVHMMLQLIPVFAHVHNHGILHRDMKPENIVIGAWPKEIKKLYIIDFGLAKQFIYRDPNNPSKKRHIPKRNPSKIPKDKITGTVRYSSRDSHYGDQGRKDDLESLGNVMLYFLKDGWLPWMGIQAKTKAQKYEAILQLKIECNMEHLLYGNYREFRIFMQSVRDMDFEDRPDYNFYERLFQRLVKRKGWDWSRGGHVDWNREELLAQKWPRFSDD